MIPDPTLNVQRIFPFWSGPASNALNPPAHRPEENTVPRRDDRPAPDRKVLLYGPDLSAVHGVPGAQLAAVAALTGVHLHVHADEGRALAAVGRGALLVHAEVLVRGVDEAGARREG